MIAFGLAVAVVWFGLLLIHTIIRHQLRAHRQHRLHQQRLNMYVGPPTIDPDLACFTVGCERNAGWLWTGADLVNRRHVCHDCGTELTGTRGGILTLR